MPYTFRIVFGGLCALRPRELDKELDVLLVNAQHELTRLLSYKPDRHVPRIQFDLADLAGGDPKLPGRGYWRFGFDDLFVRFAKGGAAGQAGPSSLKFRGNLGVRKGGRPADEDFAWVPRVIDAVPDVGKVQPDCFAAVPSKDPAKGFVMGRVTLTRGEARAYQFAEYKQQVVLAEFLPRPAGSVAAAMPHLACVEAELADDEVVQLVTQPFGGKERTPIELRPRSAGRAVQVYLTNLCCGGYDDEEQGQLPAADEDFECFYVLFDNFETELSRRKLPIPTPVEYPADISKKAAGGGNPIKCSMTRIG